MTLELPGARPYSGITLLRVITRQSPRVGFVSPELESVRRETERATRGISPDALLRAPHGKWNSLQVLEHLVLSYTATTKGLLRTMAAGQPERSNRNLQQRIRSLYVLWVGRFPAGIESPKQTTPKGGLGDEPLRQFNDALVAMDATLTDAEKRFGANTRILLHPILGPLTAQQWRRFHQVHGRHHLKQIIARAGGHAYRSSRD
jgi:Protein of unknown function (DUF1569)